MKLKEWYEKIYKKLVAEGPFRFVLKIPFMEKLLQYEVISYLVFGVLTTVVNLIVFGIFNRILSGGDEKTFTLFGRSVGINYAIATAIAWLAAVIFAYITNKLFVFESRSTEKSVMIRELVSFFGARVFSFLAFEELLAYVCLFIVGDDTNMKKWLVKLFVAVVNVAFNYVASKLVIFRKKDNEKNNSDGNESE